MLGLIVIAVLGLYLLVTVLIVSWVISDALQRGKNAFIRGGGALLVMYLIPFWDLIPTLVAEKYHCETDAGFFVYKTVNQWKEENPRIIETLSLAHLPEQYRITDDPLFAGDRRYFLPDGTSLTARFDGKGWLGFIEYKKTNGESGIQLNERIRKSYKHEGPGLIKLSREEYQVIDIKTNEVLARQVNFQKSTKGRFHNTLGGSGWKTWFQTYERCDIKKFPNGGIQRYIEEFDIDCINNKRGEGKERDGIIIACPWRN